MSGRLRTVIVGFGGIADRLADDPVMARHVRYATHAQVLAEHPAFQWDAVVDPDDGALARARERWGIETAVRDGAELPRDARFDVAVLATAPAERRAALERLPSLRAVVIEKPVAPSLAEAGRLAQLVAARGLVAQVNYWRRADETCRALAAGGLAARIGRVQAAFGLYGNGLRNNASHLVDLARMLLGEVVEARALGPARPLPTAPIASDVAVPFALTLHDGTVVTVQTLDFRHYREVALDLWGTEGRLTLDQETLAIRRFPARAHRALADAREIASDAPEPLPTTVGNALWRLYDDLAESCRGGHAPCSPLNSALVSEAVVEAVLDSARQGGALVALPATQPAMVADVR